MTKLIPLFCVCFILAWLSETNSVYDYEKERYIYKEKTFFTLLTIIIVLFAGLRTAYNDTETYITNYNGIEINGIFRGISWKLGDYPGFVLVQNIMKTLGFSSQIFIFLFAFFTIGVELWFVRKYTNNIILSVILFFTMGCLGFAMGAIKQCASIAFCLIAVDRQIQKKYLQFFIFVFIGSLFHPFSILFLITPLLEFRPWTIRTNILIASAVVLGISMQSWLGRLIDFIGLMGKDYDESMLVGEGVNAFRLAVLWAPVLLSLLTIRFWDKTKEDRVQNIIVNLMMLNAIIMFIALFGNPIYFGRLANYFLIFQVLGLSFLLQYFETRSRKLLMFVIVICYLGYWYYGNVISGTSFDASFRSIGIFQFLNNF